MVREDTGNTALLARSLYKSSIRSEQDHMTTNDADIEAFLSENDSLLKKDVGVGCIPRRGEWDKPDGRLHYEYPLYCEGMPKPAFRGIFHLLCCFIIPFGMWILVKESNGNAYSIVASVLYMLTNLWCYGASAMYHVGTWSAKTEILLQKLDHAGIAIMSVGTFLPTIALLLPPQEGLLFLFLLLATCAKNIHGIMNLQPSLVGQVVVPATSVLFFYRLYEVFTPSELGLYFVTIFLKICGVLVFVRKKPDPFPAIFGYHEVFHCFVIAAGAAIYTCNYSIVRRASADQF